MNSAKFLGYSPIEAAFSFYEALLTDSGYLSIQAALDFLPQKLNDKADLTYLDDQLSGKADLNYVNTTRQAVSEKGIANGYASLDATGKIPSTQLPASLTGGLNYQGTWNAQTNTPAIPPPAATNKGHYYKVNVGTPNNETYSWDNAGSYDWSPGDWLISNGTSWDTIDNTDLVRSVFGFQGDVTLASLPVITTNQDTDLLLIGRAGSHTVISVSNFVSGLSVEVNWQDIKNKPASYPPATHNHGTGTENSFPIFGANGTFSESLLKQNYTHEIALAAGKPFRFGDWSIRCSTSESQFQFSKLIGSIWTHWLFVVSEPWANAYFKCNVHLQEHVNFYKTMSIDTNIIFGNNGGQIGSSISKLSFYGADTISQQTLSNIGVTGPAPMDGSFDSWAWSRFQEDRQKMNQIIAVIRNLGLAKAS